MKIRIFNVLLAATLALTLAGCGGGGGGGGTTAPAAGTTLSGVASKGLIKNGQNNVKVFALNADGSKGALLATASTGPSGEYSADVGSYAGAVLVEVSGSYTDEATGQTVAISADKPLRAAVDSVSGNVTVAVTPLTELAVKKAGTALTPANIKAANAVVTDLWKVDIIGTKPVEPTSAALNAADTTDQQRKYTLAIATISQMANSTTVDAVHAVLDDMKLNIEASADGKSMSQAEVDKIKAAQTTFFDSSNTNNKTGETAPPQSLSNIGLKTAVVKLSIGGVSGKIYGVDATLVLPAGVTVVAAANGDASGAVKVSGGAGGSLAAPKYTAASTTAQGKVRIGLVSGSGFSAGEFVAVNCDIAPEKAVSPDGFKVESGAVVDDGGGVPIAGATVTSSVTTN
jgi:hypothetical protein